MTKNPSQSADQTRTQKEEFITQTAHDTVEAMMGLGLRAAVCIAVWKAADGSLMSAAPSQMMDEPAMAAVAQLYRSLADDIEKRLPAAGLQAPAPKAAAQKEPNLASTMLRAFVFCREAQVKPSGVNLVDIHDTRLSDTFPARFPELFLYVSFKVLRREPVELALRVKLPNGATHLVATSTVMPDDSLVVLLPVDLKSYEFHMPGPHNFALHADGRLLAWSVLTISSPRDLVSPPPARSAN